MQHLILNEKELRYELLKDGYLLTLDYLVNPNRKVLELTHVFVPPPGRGRGLGHIIVGKVLQDIKKRGLKVIPICPFIVRYIRENPEWKELVS